MTAADAGRRRIEEWTAELVPVAALTLAILALTVAPAQSGEYVGNFNPNATLDTTQVINPNGDAR